MVIYKDRAGDLYRSVCECPYSELSPGDHFAVPGEPTVYTRGTVGPPECANPFMRWIESILYNARVTLLERITD